MVLIKPKLGAWRFDVSGLLDMRVIDVRPFARIRADRPVFVLISARFGLSSSNLRAAESSF